MASQMASQIASQMASQKTNLPTASNIMSGRGGLNSIPSSPGNIMTNLMSDDMIPSPRDGMKSILGGNFQMKQNRMMVDESSNHTYPGLMKWYHEIVSKFGWVIIASNEGHYEKIHHYCMEMDHFVEAVKAKYISLQSIDKKKDLEIIYAKVLDIKNIICKISAA